MKTMRKNDDIVRVKETDVTNFLSNGYNYCPKKVWKDNVRVIKNKKEEIKESIEKKTTKSGKK